MKLLLILFLFSSISFSQKKEKTKINYFDYQNEKISHNKFKRKLNHKINLDVCYSIDSNQYNCYLVKREIRGKLDSTFHKKRIKYLNKITQNEINFIEPIVIHHLSALQGSDNINQEKSRWNIFNKPYLREIKRKYKVKPFYIYDSRIKSKWRYEHDWITLIKDERNILQKHFIKHLVRYGSIIIVYPNGDYYIYLGESGSQHVLIELENHHKKNK